MNSSYGPALVQAAQQGDTEALEQLLLQCQPDIIQFARKVCATPEDVEDAVQETLWIVSQKIGTLRTVSAFVAWVFRVVRHECYRLFHQTRGETPINEIIEPSYLEDSTHSSTWLRREVTVALKQLPFIYRQVVVMRDIEEMTAPEVAAALGLTIEAVKSRLHRGRKMIRVALQHWMN